MTSVRKSICRSKVKKIPKHHFLLSKEHTVADASNRLVRYEFPLMFLTLGLGGTDAKL